MTVTSKRWFFHRPPEQSTRQQYETKRGDECKGCAKHRQQAQHQQRLDDREMRDVDAVADVAEARSIEFRAGMTTTSA
ncbi:hypothetical protein [Henriciella litoralis]|uniref:hypothetical protein n=1 Tax=Henriciella litoralis TaxID=568102 RepID=UPI00111C2318|nr:hypothetical protein [Henriciella litoralis]